MPATQILAAAGIGWLASSRARPLQDTARPAGWLPIKALLGLTSNATLDKALRGEPPPEWTRRPNAKDEVRGNQGWLPGEDSNLR